MLSIQKSLKGPAVHWADTALVLINALVITLFNMAVFSHNLPVHQLLGQLSYLFLYLFIVIEIIRVLMERKNFFKDHRNIFVVLVLIAAITLGLPELTILLLFNTLRTLRIINLFPKTRHVIDTLFHSLPGAMNLLLLIFLAYFIFAVLGTNLYGHQVPELWGSIPQSLLSLQQIMLGDDWGNNLRATLKFYPNAWIFSTAFLIVVTFVLLNVFVGVIVDAMQTAEVGDDSESEMEALQKEVKRLRQDIAVIKQAVTKNTTTHP